MRRARAIIFACERALTFACVCVCSASKLCGALPVVWWRMRAGKLELLTAWRSWLRWQVPENLDRLVKDVDTDIGSTMRSGGVETVTYGSSEHVEPLPGWSTRNSAAMAQWEDAFRAALASRETAVVLLVGPPGIGKTVYAERFLRDYANTTGAGDDAFRFIDGSKDEFTRTALADVLHQRAVRGRTLLVDEFHFMSAELKRQLLQWQSSRGMAMRVRLLLIANRVDPEDLALFERADLRERKIVVCARGRLEKCITKGVYDSLSKGAGLDWQRELAPSVMPQEWVRSMCFAMLWLRGCNALFGQEMLAIRPVAALMSAFNALDQEALEQELARQLQAKASTLPMMFCREFVHSLMAWYLQLLVVADSLAKRVCEDNELHVARGDPLAVVLGNDGVETKDCEVYELGCFEAVGAAGERWPAARRLDKGHLLAMFLRRLSAVSRTHVAVAVQAGMLDGGGRPVELFVRAALLDDDHAMSYPEFASSKDIVRDGLLHQHPISRLAWWLMYMYERAMPGCYTADTLDSLRTLLRDAMCVVDLPMRFPQVTLGLRASMELCDVVCSDDAHPRSLESMKAALVRGFAVRWGEAVAYWANNPIADVNKFTGMVAAWSGALEKIIGDAEHGTAMTDQLLGLLARGSPELARRCADLRVPCAARSSPALRSWPGMFAQWRLFRDDLSGAREMMRKLEPVGRARLMLWVAQYGYSTMSITRDPSEPLAERTAAAAAHGRLLLSYLLETSGYLCDLAQRGDASASADLARLWSGHFARLPDPEDDIVGASAPSRVPYMWLWVIAVEHKVRGGGAERTPGD